MGLVSSSRRVARSRTCSVNFSPPTVSTAYASRAWSGDVAKPATYTRGTVVLQRPMVRAMGRDPSPGTDREPCTATGELRIYMLTAAHQSQSESP